MNVVKKCKHCCEAMAVLDALHLRLELCRVVLESAQSQRFSGASASSAKPTSSAASFSIRMLKVYMRIYQLKWGKRLNRIGASRLC